MVAVGRLLARGGEGEVYAVSSPSGTVFKRYLPVAFGRDPALEERLRAMIAHPPTQWREPESCHVTLAWPTDLVLEDGRFAGFLMAAVETSDTVELHRVTNPDDRRRATGKTAWVQGFSWKYLVHAAANLAQATQMLHEAGVVIGDFNERNARVTRDARITLLDCDSMQISDPATGGRFFCRVGRPEYTPPELIHADWSKTVRHASSDLFALAIHIYQFLLEGEQPFRGKWTGPGDKPSVTDLASQGTWVQQSGGMLQPRPSAVSAQILPDSIIELFRAVFENGAVNPGARPSAQTWHHALVDLEGSLRQCLVNADHFYADMLPKCPWCEHDGNLSKWAARSNRQVPLPVLPDISVAHRPSLYRAISPTADSWNQAYTERDYAVSVCAQDPSHRYPAALQKCPFCAQAADQWGQRLPPLPYTDSTSSPRINEEYISEDKVSHTVRKIVQRQIELGYPTCLPITQDEIERVPKLRNAMSDGEKWEFRLLRITPTFHDDRRSPFSEAYVHVALETPGQKWSGEEIPTAWWMEPGRVTGRIHHSRGFKISPSGSHVGGDVNFGTDFDKSEPFILAYGTQCPSAYWKFAKTREYEIQGSHELTMVIRMPRNCRVQAFVEASAITVRRRFGVKFKHDESGSNSPFPVTLSKGSIREAEIQIDDD